MRLGSQSQLGDDRDGHSSAPLAWQRGSLRGCVRGGLAGRGEAAWAADERQQLGRSLAEAEDPPSFFLVCV